MLFFSWNRNRVFSGTEMDLKFPFRVVISKAPYLSQFDELRNETGTVEKSLALSFRTAPVSFRNALNCGSFTSFEGGNKRLNFAFLDGYSLMNLIICI